MSNMLLFWLNWGGETDCSSLLAAVFRGMTNISNQMRAETPEYLSDRVSSQISHLMIEGIAISTLEREGRIDAGWRSASGTRASQTRRNRPRHDPFAEVLLCTDSPTSDKRDRLSPLSYRGSVNA